MNSEQIYKMLAKYFTGESSPEEIKKVNDWINENPGNQLFYDDVKAVWENILPKNKVYNINSVWDNVKSKSIITGNERQKTNNEKKKLSFQVFNYLKIAAGIIVMIGFTYLYLDQTHKLESSKNSISVKQIVSDKDEIRKVRLEDGTIVTLNSESTLIVPEEFSQNERIVSLTGEAYFEVQHNQNKPFIVNTQNSVITVLGTKFNITSWKESDEVVVAVADGRVSFGSTSNTPDENVIINKNEMSIISKGNKPIAPIKVDTEKYYLFWMNDELNFYNASFKNIIHRLEMKYGINISVEDVSILSKQLTANFKNEPLKEILKTLSIALDLKYSENENLIVFSYENK